MIRRLYEAEVDSYHDGSLHERNYDDVEEEEEEEDDNPYHNKKYEALYAYDHVPQVANDQRLFAAAAVAPALSASFMTAMSSAGASAAAIGTATAGAGGAVALAGGPIGVAYYVVVASLSVAGWTWNWDGVAWPGAKWKNPMTLDLASDSKAWVWTEEWSGRVFAYEYPNRATAIKKAMDKWWCSRILVTWNRDKLRVEFEDERGMGWAHSTIKTQANAAYLQQFKKNVEDLVVGRTITKEDVEKYLQ